MWYDNWCKLGPLANIIPKKARNVARMKDNDFVADLVHNGVWLWPTEWLRLYPELNQVVVPNFTQSKDTVWDRRIFKDEARSVKELNKVIKKHMTDMLMSLNVKSSGALVDSLLFGFHVGMVTVVLRGVWKKDLCFAGRIAWNDDDDVLDVLGLDSRYKAKKGMDLKVLTMNNSLKALLQNRQCIPVKAVDATVASDPLVGALLSEFIANQYIFESQQLAATCSGNLKRPASACSSSLQHRTMSVVWASFGTIYLCYAMLEVYRVLFEVFGLDQEAEECQPKLRRELEDVDHCLSKNRRITWNDDDDVLDVLGLDSRYKAKKGASSRPARLPSRPAGHQRASSRPVGWG
ncbi:hypothetical protein Tco_1142394 [Tanacetum coccineum]